MTNIRLGIEEDSKCSASLIPLWSESQRVARWENPVDISRCEEWGDLKSWFAATHQTSWLQSIQMALPGKSPRTNYKLTSIYTIYTVG